MAAGRREYGRIPADKWRKHMHWFSLTRFHAELVSNDTDVSNHLCSPGRSMPQTYYEESIDEKQCRDKKLELSLCHDSAERLSLVYANIEV